MTIKEFHHNGGANYGWGLVYCDTCANGSGPLNLAEFDKGKYDQTSLTPEKIKLLRKAAKKHDLKTGGNHSIRTIIYSKNS